MGAPARMHGRTGGAGGHGSPNTCMHVRHADVGRRRDVRGRCRDDRDGPPDTSVRACGACYRTGFRPAEVLRS